MPHTNGMVWQWRVRVFSIWPEIYDGNQNQAHTICTKVDRRFERPKHHTHVVNYHFLEKYQVHTQ